MQTFETTDLKVARRCRMAQYRGREGRINIGGMAINCIVRAVMDIPALSPKSWTVTIERIEEKPRVSWKGKRVHGF